MDLIIGINWLKWNAMKDQAHAVPPDFIAGICLCKYQDRNILQYYYFHGRCKEYAESFAKQSNITLYNFYYQPDGFVDVCEYDHFGSSGRYGRYTFTKSYRFLLEENGLYQYIGFQDSAYMIKDGVIRMRERKQ